MCSEEQAKIFGLVFVKRELRCIEPMESSYYSSKLPIFTDICCWCGGDDCYVDTDKKKLFKVVFPICRRCSDSGKEILTRAPIIAAAAAQKKASKKRKQGG